jgi:hypothetical protein
MKKIISFALCFAMLFLFCACTEQPKDGEEAYTLNLDGTTVAIHDDFSVISAKLGAHLDYGESPSCGYDGLDKTYTYAHLEVQTYPKDGKEYINFILLLDDTYGTAEGIFIGDAAEKVKTVYGTPTEESANGNLRYEKGNMRLDFLVKNGKVNKIQYANPDGTN